LRDGVPKAAWEWLDGLVDKNRAPEAEAVTVEYLCNAYLAWHKSQGATMALRGYQRLRRMHLRRFAAYRDFATRDAARFPVAELDGFIRSLDGLSRNYIATLTSTVRAAFRWGTKPIVGRKPERLIAANPFDGFTFPRHPKAVRGFVETRVFRRFARWVWGQVRHKNEFDARYDRLYLLMLRFQRQTGCRPGEAYGLRWGDIQWERERIIIPPERHKTGKKTHDERVIHLTPPTLRLLRAIEGLEGRHAEYVFTHRRARGGSHNRLHKLAGVPWEGSSSAAADKLRTWRDAAIELRAQALKTRRPDPFPGLEDTGPRKFSAYLTRHAYVSKAVALGLTHEQTARLVGNTAQVIGSSYAHAIEELDAGNARAVMTRGRSRSV
jgi:integrase